MKARRMAPLTEAERETVIVFSDAEDDVMTIDTSQPPMIRLLRRLPGARLVEERRSEGGALTGVRFEVPFTHLALLSQPRASTWARMLRSGPRSRARRQRSLVSVQRGQEWHLAPVREAAAR